MNTILVTIIYIDKHDSTVRINPGNRYLKTCVETHA